MAINKDEWKELDKKIAKAIEESRPRGWRKALHLLREWGVLSANITVIVALIGILAAAVYQATARIAKETAFETQTAADLKEIRSDIGSLRGDLERDRAQAAIDQAGVEAKIGKNDAAMRHIGNASDLIAKLRSDRVPAPSSFFQSTIDTLDGMRLLKFSAADVSPALVQLAQYRSALQPAPPPPPSDYRDISSPITPQQIQSGGITFVVSEIVRVVVFIQGSNHRLKGGNFVIKSPTTIFIYVGTDRTPQLKDNVFVSDSFVKGGTQALDGVHWSNMTFVGTHIEYAGGELQLSNVRFIDCIFDVPSSDRGAQVAQYAALDAKELTIVRNSRS